MLKKIWLRKTEITAKLEQTKASAEKISAAREAENKAFEEFCSTPRGKKYLGIAIEKTTKAKEVHRKQCRVCNKTPQEVNFPRHPGFFDGFDSICKECKKKRARKKYESLSTEERKIEHARKKKSRVSSDLYKNFGITIEDYSNMLLLQGNKCKICGRTPEENTRSLVVDHCHYSNKVRGLLCDLCNSGIAKLGERNSAFTLAAIEYISDTRSWVSPYATHIKSGASSNSKDYELRRKFGITIEDYARFYASQNGSCKICKTPHPFIKENKQRALAVDHCHKTKQIRGLLCFSCNSALGIFKDNPILLQRAADYLLEFEVDDTQRTEKNIADTKQEKARRIAKLKTLREQRAMENHARRMLQRAKM